MNCGIYRMDQCLTRSLCQRADIPFACEKSEFHSMDDSYSHRSLVPLFAFSLTIFVHVFESKWTNSSCFYLYFVSVFFFFLDEYAGFEFEIVSWRWQARQSLGIRSKSIVKPFGLRRSSVCFQQVEIDKIEDPNEQLWAYARAQGECPCRLWLVLFSANLIIVIITFFLILLLLLEIGPTRRLIANWSLKSKNSLKAVSLFLIVSNFEAAPMLLRLLRFSDK